MFYLLCVLIIAIIMRDDDDDDDDDTGLARMLTLLADTRVIQCLRSFVNEIFAVLGMLRT
jgi:hypothetical protein